MKNISRPIILFFLLASLFTGTVYAGNGAQFVNHSVPSTMAVGQIYAVSVTMKNTGTTTWTAANSYRLGSQNPRDNLNWGLNRVYLTAGESIAPGQSKTFTFNVTAPATPGNYSFQWKMLRELVEWFGDASTNVVVSVVQPWNVYINNSHHSFKGVGWNLNTPSAEQQYYLDESTPQFLRYIWYIENFQVGENNKTYNSTTAAKTTQFLQHTTEKNISVMLTNWNSGGKWDNYYSCLPPTCSEAWPDHAFWLSEISHNDPTNSQNRFCHRHYTGDPGICSEEDKTSRINVKGPESDHPYSDTVFAQVLADNLEYLVYTENCSIDFLSLWNEPAGDWSYHPRNASKKYPSSFTGLYQSVYQKLQEKNLGDLIKIVGSDDAGPSTSVLDYALINWSPYVQSYGFHNYDCSIGSGGKVKYLYDRAGGKPVIIGETGHRGEDGCGSGGFDLWGNSIESTRMMISDIRYGAYAVARWWFRGGDASTDCWVAMNNSVPVYANYNSLKILANTLPQISEDISVVNTDFGDFNESFDAVVINAAPLGQTRKPVVWAVNKNTQNTSLALNFSGLNESVTLTTKYLVGVSPYAIVSSQNYTISPQNPVVLFTVPANSIFVAQSATTTSTTTTSTSSTSTTMTTSTSTTTTASTTTTSTAATTSTSTTTAANTSLTTTTISQNCVMPGNYAPCEEASLGEVIDAITAWVEDTFVIGDVIDLISAWAGTITAN